MQIGTKSLPSVMQHSFSHIPQARIPRSSFIRNYAHKTTFNADYLIPFFWDEVYPADTIQFNLSYIIRMITPSTPFMDNLYADFFYFFVPFRLIQDNWEKLMGAQDDPGDSIDFSTPKLTAPASTGYTTPTDWSSPTTAQLAGALQDYLGVPPGVADLEHHNYCGRAYNLIWNEWFRDENLQDSLTVDLDDGPDTYTDYILQKRGKRHDYFTSCLPWLQKGTAESVPIGTEAPVLGIGAHNQTFGASSVSAYETDGSGTTTYADAKNVSGSVNTNNSLYIEEDTGNAGFPWIRADLTSATGSTIAALYQAFAIQELLQQDARGGTRYVELINSHFGVTSPDFRLQRPEYLGGASVPIMVTPLAQTSETATTELGTLAATATGQADNVGFFKGFVEHGIVIGMVSVRADLTYQQGLHRCFLRDTRYDFYFPALANLAEQEVTNVEIFAQGDSNDDLVFGYQERWSELKFGRSSISGRMRSSDASTLDVWHLSEEFGSLPSLNSDFIESNTPVDRVTAVTSEPHFKGDFYAKSKWARPMPMYSVPGLQNRF